MTRKLTTNITEPKRVVPTPQRSKHGKKLFSAQKKWVRSRNERLGHLLLSSEVVGIDPCVSGCVRLCLECPRVSEVCSPPCVFLSFPSPLTCVFSLSLSLVWFFLPPLPCVVLPSPALMWFFPPFSWCVFLLPSTGVFFPLPLLVCCFSFPVCCFLNLVFSALPRGVRGVR